MAARVPAAGRAGPARRRRRHGGLRLDAPRSRDVLRGERELRAAARGRAEARRRARRAARPAAAARPTTRRCPARTRPLFEALRALRAQLAREQNLPAYVIFHDATLRAMARERPRDLDALARVNGVGASKLERYGERVLAVLRDAA